MLPLQVRLRLPRAGGQGCCVCCRGELSWAAGAATSCTPVLPLPTPPHPHHRPPNPLTNTQSPPQPAPVVQPTDDLRRAADLRLGELGTVLLWADRYGKSC